MRRELAIQIPGLIGQAPKMIVGEVDRDASPRELTAKLAISTALNIIGSEENQAFQRQLLRPARPHRLREAVLYPVTNGIMSVRRLDQPEDYPALVVLATDLHIIGNGHTAFIRRDADEENAIFSLDKPESFADYMEYFLRFLASDKHDLEVLNELSFGASQRSKVADIENALGIQK